MKKRQGPNHRLRALLTEAGWTQEALARSVNILGAEIGSTLRYDRTAVAHWLSGTQPRHPVPQLAAEALSRRIGRAITPEAAGFADVASEGPPIDPVTGFTALCRSDADAARRVPLHQRPYRVADAVVPHPPQGPARFRGLGQRAEETKALHDAVEFFATSIDSHGGRHARSALSAYLADDVVPLLGSRQTPRMRAELLVLASRLAFLLARMYEDGLLHGVAQRYYNYAQRLAGESGDRTAWSVVLRAMSAQAQRLGHLPSALQLAEAAQQGAHGAPPAHQAYVGTQLAVVLARSGDRREALAVLGRAERAAEQAGGAGAPFDSYPTAALHFQTAGVLEALGDLPGALGALRRSAVERSPSDLRGRALTQARFGQLLLRAGRLDEACAAWSGFLDGRERLRSGDAEQALRAMRQALHPYRNRRQTAELLSRTPQGR
ncbi:tetratricopeptide repeat protein [Streptomyces triticirhizae]|uniref:Tetratricopeptide repeat protein n=1 Tax=Streptomyces triticirhizae TaxID=2483353 RepID=A0A3M2M9T8_9ACTN|nr:tetratricopeptide repeat protein [Streptomyces triticirhizae]RMI46239.1 tetratricopeptide repeat protein [Streptomyces triticirhizae]